jgi:aspartyl-tRNA(Asn)/glutamyl-tRNA(Gln) amidotransferase subunit C
MIVTKKEIIRAEKLARLNLPESKVEEFSTRLSKVFSWIDQLKEVGIEGTKPLVNPMMDFMGHAPMRKDEVCQTNTVTDVLSNAPDKDHDFFLVPKVVE